MPSSSHPEKTPAELLSKLLVEMADQNGQLLTILDLQACILARLEQRSEDDVVDEINTLLKARRREALREIDAWAQGHSSMFLDDPSDGEA